MTARIFVTLAALAGLAIPTAHAATARAESGTVLVQAATPQPTPVAPSTGSGTAPAAPQATPPAATPPPAAPQATPPAATPPPAAAAQPAPQDQTMPDTSGGQDGAVAEDTGDTPDSELSLGDIPTIETMELTPELARRALDSYIMAKSKYADTDLDQYENLQDFVDQTEDGKKFEADVKAAGFADVTGWNLAVTTLGLTYSSLTDDQTSDLEQQIKEVEDDKELAQDIKDKMAKALRALIPSANNRKVIQDLMNDPVYGTKLKQLDMEEE
ncbi:hypothetical protein [Aestuariivirga sp.]|uniref:hypothetical protein n=1 Tax=Aestuariivirga sp. TaxID=2650926 RepID=UPI0025C05A2D|nr:hypothetical protein [Aestuariivirga sp.]MCA3555264.1 hypothetical protein [Aestuariivirga sp.]